MRWTCDNVLFGGPSSCALQTTCLTMLRRAPPSAFLHQNDVSSVCTRESANFGVVRRRRGSGGGEGGPAEGRGVRRRAERIWIGQQTVFPPFGWRRWRSLALKWSRSALACSALDHLTKNVWDGDAVLERLASLGANLLFSFSELSFGLGAFVLNLSAVRQRGQC